jgi:hypothetical protein
MLQKKWLPLLLVLVIAAKAKAQITSGKNEIGIHAGALFYQGDLAPDMVGSYKTARPTVGIFYNRILTPYWAVRANVVVGALAGDDALNEKPAYMRRRRFNFHTPLAEVSALAVFNLFGNNANDNVVKFSPYLFAGAGVSFLNIHRDWSQVDSSLVHAGSTTLTGLVKDTTTVMENAIPVLPIGVGIKYGILPNISLIAEGNYRFLFTDYLDGFSYAANPKRKDGYYGLTVGAVYNFGSGGSGGRWKKPGKSKTDCPKVF